MMNELLRIAHLRITLYWEFLNFTSPILATVLQCMNVMVQATYGESHTSHSLPYSFQGNAAPYGDSTVYQEVLPSQVKRSCIIIIHDALLIFVLFFVGDPTYFCFTDW